MATYIHQLPSWPKFQSDAGALSALLAAVRHRQGRLLGTMTGLGFRLQEEAVLRTLTQDVVKSSEIEGEILDEAQVRSSVGRRLGMDIGAALPVDPYVDGVVEMMLDATQRYLEPLTAERLFGWHASLFPTGRSGMLRITVGGWRTDERGPMQVVSNPYGRARVHYEAPAAPLLDGEMRAFLEWFNGPIALDPVLKAAIAHLWFVTVHPFDDGNGRIARAIADMALARADQTPRRFYSMSAQIQLERRQYYDLLESTQKGDLDITAWLRWFFECLDRALTGAERLLGAVLAKAEFWKRHGTSSMNDRQRDMVNRLLDGFTGKLTSSKWAKIEKCSPDTALRDITDLVNRGILARDGAGGRSTSYSLADSDPDDQKA
ncbi:Fic family protein [Reyranella sp.]|uniref:Fic family protein n=1 Tax=Reyranella sp. TaxID=1929291 RepID=UPI003D0DD3BD